MNWGYGSSIGCTRRKGPRFSNGDLDFLESSLRCIESSSFEPGISPLFSSFGGQLDHLFVCGEISFLSLLLSDGLLGWALSFVRYLADLVIGIVAQVGWGNWENGLHDGVVVLEAGLVTKFLRFSDHLLKPCCLRNRKFLDSSFHINYLFFNLSAIWRVTGNYRLKIDIIAGLLATAILLMSPNFATILVILARTLIDILVVIADICLTWPWIILLCFNEMLRSWVATDTFPNALGYGIDVRNFHDAIWRRHSDLFEAKQHFLSMRQPPTAFPRLSSAALSLLHLNSLMHAPLALKSAKTTNLLVLNCHLLMGWGRKYGIWMDEGLGWEAWRTLLVRGVVYHRIAAVNWILYVDYVRLLPIHLKFRLKEINYNN